MANSTRTFIALEIPEGPAGKIGRLIETLRPAWPCVRWAESGHFHLTLAFLGDVAHLDMASVCKAVQEAASPFAPFELAIQGLGMFPSPAKPRVLWAGIVGADGDPLGRLQRAIAEAVNAVGYPADDRFHPHVTLGRMKPGQRLAVPADELIARHAGWKAGAFRAREAIVFSSSLSPDGPVYAPLSRAPLRGRSR